MLTPSRVMARSAKPDVAIRFSFESKRDGRRDKSAPGEDGEDGEDIERGLYPPYPPPSGNEK